MAIRPGVARSLRALLAIVVALGLLAAVSAGAAARGVGNTGTVYTSSNDAAGNAVLAYRRAADGSLSTLGTFPTGGNGTGAGLGNQGAVTLSANGRWLLVVNAGSDSVSVFSVRSNGLQRTDVQDSGGDMPISVTISGDVVYVLNEGGSGNISGFRLGRAGDLVPLAGRAGDLVPLAGSTRPLSGGGVDPAQIAFSPNGRVLAVTEKNTNLIDTYTVNRNGLASGPQTHASAGMTPFGFAFSPRGHLIVSEAFGGAPDASALSSYFVGNGADLDLVSGSVGTTETAACWVVVTGNGKYVYTTNTGSASITGYRVGHDGSLTLLDADGKTGQTGTTPIDVAISANSQFVYNLNAGSHSISAFRVNADGSLTSLPGIAGLPASANGLAAR
jgi:6-phosphogluconolactonase (cycloisomerase 2 family)